MSPRDRTAAAPDPAETPKERHESVTVSFIIPALNEERHIGQCLRAIQNVQLPSAACGIEVIVVDNHSSDRTAELGRENGARVVDVTPGSPSRARNAGARLTSGEWLAFVDADCVLAPDWLMICSAHLLTDPNAIGAAGVMRAPSDDQSWVEKSMYQLAHGGRAVEAKAVAWLPTFNLLVRRSAFESVGGFDESLTTCEDCDLGYKLARLGNLIIDPRTTAAHHGASHSLGQLFRREAWRSQGNARLAVSRPFDWSNWLSLLVPPGIIGGFALSAAGFLAAISAGWPSWPWLIAMAIFPLLVTGIVLRKAGFTGVTSFVKQCAVLTTYFAGRAAGLFWPFRRVNR
ncbi:MAG: glycosyltransferase [Pirellulales bacterium]